MAAIEKIECRLRTGNDGTDGDVYLGICGREFYLDSSSNDFERGADDTYVMGLGAAILERQYNDPRSPYRLKTENLDNFPTYIRFAPKGRDDNWRLESVQVSVFSSSNQVDAEFQALGGSDNLWLGVRRGLYCYLFRR